MDATPVTNRQFKDFVEATGYMTTAEKAPILEEIMAQVPPGTPPPPQNYLCQLPWSLNLQRASTIKQQSCLVGMESREQVGNIHSDPEAPSMEKKIILWCK